MFGGARTGACEVNVPELVLALPSQLSAAITSSGPPHELQPLQTSGEGFVPFRRKRGAGEKACFLLAAAGGDEAQDCWGGGDCHQ